MKNIVSSSIKGKTLLINKDQHKPGIPVTYKMLTDGNASFVEKNSAGNRLIFKCLLKPVKERTEEK